ncbi:flagellar hook-associated protein 3 [Sinimarinibacterium sp. CAU 1509]|uniref:flagellar hook-associated protein FlgL n=1 Tax=Sinimarinibacterium sp. CAU 1509 TaxID=2562283 RepID=UPI0010ABDAB7|nr:flagellar hook-associated protein FlgL [Sinimarinibacterium sp. CAU 1509]TJY62869.1 flagellar hook-associated protein 3 [Sinimarinibacterium sp. CAU 1509]
MRISTAQFYKQSVDQMLHQQAALARTQNQLTSEQKWSRAGDDPTGYANAMGMDQNLAQLERYTSNAQSVQQRLYLEEDSLASATDILQSVRELSIQANTASQSDENRATIATQLRSLRDQLLAVANQDDGQGRYLFGGTADASAPFSWSGGSATYNGNQQVSDVQIGSSRSVAAGDAGSEVFMRLKTGNGTFAVQAGSGNTGSLQVGSTGVTDASLWDGGSYSVSFSGGNYEIRDTGNTVIQSGAYSEGQALSFRGVNLAFSGTPADGDSFSVGPSQAQDAFALIDKLANLIEQPQSSGAQRAQFQTALQQSLTELSAAETHVTSVQSSVGVRLAATDGALDLLSTQNLHVTEALSNLRDVDVVEAASRLQQQMVALQAAQKSYVSVQGLSLFDYLR